MQILILRNEMSVEELTDALKYRFKEIDKAIDYHQSQIDDLEDTMDGIYSLLEEKGIETDCSWTYQGEE